MIIFRTMVEEDIASGLSLCRAAAWNQVQSDWQILLNEAPEGCQVAVNDAGEVVGTVTTINYKNHFSWIGMVLVDPEHQRQGIGMQILKAALAKVSPQSTVKLDATPAGREVYLKLNFQDEYVLTRMQHTSIYFPDLPSGDVRPMETVDIDELDKFDEEVFGANRKSVLSAILQDNSQFAFVSHRGGALQGYCFGRKGHRFIQIGPVIANNLKDAKELVAASLRRCEGSSVIIDILNHFPAWEAWLIKIGFTEQRAFMRMYRGRNMYAGMPEKQFAILGPEFG